MKGHPSGLYLLQLLKLFHCIGVFAVEVVPDRRQKSVPAVANLRIPVLLLHHRQVPRKPGGFRVVEHQVVDGEAELASHRIAVVVGVGGLVEQRPGLDDVLLRAHRALVVGGRPRDGRKRSIRLVSCSITFFVLYICFYLIVNYIPTHPSPHKHRRRNHAQATLHNQVTKNEITRLEKITSRPSITNAKVYMHARALLLCDTSEEKKERWTVEDSQMFSA